MGKVNVAGKAREASIKLTVIRANGAVEHLGVVSYYHRNLFRRWAFHIRRWLGLN